jgi:hypothetical protein
MYAFATSVAATRRIAALVVLAAVGMLTALALMVSGGHHAGGSSTASPRWNTAVHVVADKAVFAKRQSPRWN